MTLRELNIVTVYKALGGELRGRRGRAFWRDGDGFNVSLDSEKGNWFDFRDGRGGGNLDLVMLARNCDRNAALSWLEINCGLDPLRPLSPSERREFVARRRAASIAAKAIAHWRRALISDLNARKGAALEAGDDDALAAAASLCNVLENGSTEDYAREFIQHRGTDSTGVTRLIAAGRQRELEDAGITAQAVRLIAAAEELRRAA